MRRIWNILTDTDVRNNVILIFSLIYGGYFGFYNGLPIMLDLSYILATFWLMLLGLAVMVMVIKIIMLAFFGMKGFVLWAHNKITESLQPFGWRVQSAR